MTQRRAVIGATLVAVLVGACSSSQATPTTEAVSPPSQVVVLTEFRFAPSSVTIEAGGEASLLLQNDGSTEHNWVLMSEAIASESEFADGNVLFEALVQPGQRLAIAFQAPPRGSYQVICSIPGHFDAGMEGSLAVE